MVCEVLLSREGTGSGETYDDGYGYGDGDGDSFGSGYGDGDGYSDGDGTGNGFGQADNEPIQGVVERFGGGYLGREGENDRVSDQGIWTWARTSVIQLELDHVPALLRHYNDDEARSVLLDLAIHLGLRALVRELTHA